MKISSLYGSTEYEINRVSDFQNSSHKYCCIDCGFKLTKVDEDNEVIRSQARHKENDAQASKLEDEKEALLANKDKIERQLRIIHELLTDPPSLERLEDYNNVFAPGNFDNLKKVATILKGQKT